MAALFLLLVGLSVVAIAATCRSWSTDDAVLRGCLGCSPSSLPLGKAGASSKRALDEM